MVKVILERISVMDPYNDYGSQIFETFNCFQFLDTDNDLAADVISGVVKKLLSSMFVSACCMMWKSQQALHNIG